MDTATPIGVLGATGTEGFPHVHYEVARNINGDPVCCLIDPRPFSRGGAFALNHVLPTAGRCGRGAPGGFRRVIATMPGPMGCSHGFGFAMDVSGITTFFTTLLDTGVKIAGLVAAVSLAAAGFMYFGVVGHNQRAMEMAQTGVRAAFIGLAFVWGARQLINLVAGAAGQPTLHEGSRSMSDDQVVYAVPTHLREREPFAFGRTVGEVAKLVAIGFVAARSQRG